MLFVSFQAKQFDWTQGRWPKKSAEFLLHMLKNAESNAELKVCQKLRLSSMPPHISELNCNDYNLGHLWINHENKSCLSNL